MEPLPPSPGADLTWNQVVGRDALIQEWWQLLGRQSLRVLGPRRTGKTCALRLLEHETPQDRAVLRMSTLQGLDPSPAAFVKRVYEDASALRPAWKRWPNYLNEAAALVSKLGIEVGSFKVAANLPSFHWWTLLAQIFTDVEQAAAAEDRLAVFVWDEVTLYLYDLVRKGAHDEAGLLLDRLRTVRQTCPHIRMVFAGSIGLDEVLRELKKQGYGNDPVNDMKSCPLPPLDEADAQVLALRLLRSFESDGANAEALARHLARIAEGHPFLLHHLAVELRQRSFRTAFEADRILTALIEGPEDALELSHYHDRLSRYLGPRTSAAEDLLDQLALQPRASLTELVAATGLVRADAQSLLRLLERDYYVEQSPDGDRPWCIKTAVLRRWWRHERGL